ncbi:MAG: butyrate kinase [Candidatus Cloacimonetes bacterium]|nr:butyrate kinase [Candidatus Cloacimonadota bacterium]MCF7813218.1 butyrate kinase [Candidatus Cloacimonadota bacterium]MCF7867417.1 butyrate kinase [Candidatus Cloacimonadota bacterium]MCF7882951.1 butyrate kinase [Candidatus Cloacimonadota bacterium]
MDYRVLAINPGSTSTKIAVFDDEKSVFTVTLRHDVDEISKFDGIIEQYDFRKKFVLKALEEHDVLPESLKAVVGRGGLIKPVKGGTYSVNEKMLEDLQNPELWGRIHASNLGAFIANSIASELGIPAFIVDPVTVDEFEPIARISGCPKIERQSLLHALNLRYCAIMVAEEKGKNVDEINQIGVHMGGGISVAAIKKGKMVDVNNAVLGMGPFSPQRAGALPIGDLLEMAFSGKYTHNEMKAMFTKTGGLISYLGTDDGEEVQKRIESGDKKAKLVFDAMIYQIAKEIGACATVLKGDLDVIFLTGGLAYNDYLRENLIKRIEFLSDIKVIPGEKEMEALSQGAVRVLKGLEEAKEYK